MTKKLKNVLKRFRRNEDGNVGMMFAVSFTASMIAIGAAIDLALVQKSKAQLQNLTDAAALAAIQSPGTTEEQQQVFRDYLDNTAALAGFNAEILSADIDIFSDGETISFDAQVDASHQLLIMNAFGDYDGIRSRASAEMGIHDVEVALVLDISSSMNGARITEAISSTRLFIDKILDDAQVNKRVAISLVPFGGTVRLPEELSYLLKNPAGGMKAYSSHWIDGEWNQCLAFDAREIDDGIVQSAKYSATPDYWSWYKSNPWCPKAGNELVPLTDDKDLLLSRVDSLTLSDGTGSDHGMLWGYETLNADWKNKFPGGLEDTPSDSKERRTKKVIVFMTDGGITSQHYVRPIDMIGTPPYNSKRKERISYTDSLNSFYALCDKAKDNDIEIFTVGYTITKAKHINPLKACASSQSNYINAASGNLERVFAGLANSISPLRLTN